MTDEIDDAVVEKALNAYHRTNAWRIAPGDEPAKMRAAILAVAPAIRERERSELRMLLEDALAELRGETPVSDSPFHITDRIDAILARIEK